MLLRLYFLMALGYWNSNCLVCQTSKKETELSATNTNWLFSKIPRSFAAHQRISRGTQFENHWPTQLR